MTKYGVFKYECRDAFCGLDKLDNVTKYSQNIDIMTVLVVSIGTFSDSFPCHITLLQ